MEKKTTALLAKPTSELLDDFGAGRASPGSGSAAALMGLLAAKLLATVCIKSKEKLDPRKHNRIDYLSSQINRHENALRDLFETDAREFDEVIIYRQKRDSARDKVEQSNFSRKANDKLQETTDTIFNIAKECLELVDLGIALFNEGWPHVRGDSGAAVSAAISGAMSCIFVASLNAKALKQRRYADECLSRCSEITRQIQSKQSSAFQCAASLSAEALIAVQLELASSPKAKNQTALPTPPPS